MTNHGIRQGNERGGSVTVTLPSDTEISITRAFAAPRELVFDAWTNCEHVRMWFGRLGDEITVCEIDLRVGGAWRFVTRLREGGEMGMTGEYKEVVRPGRLVNTEMFEGPEFGQMGAGTLNTLTLEEAGGRTTMTINVAYGSREARDGALRTPMKEGMNENFARLAAHLESMR